MPLTPDGGTSFQVCDLEAAHRDSSTGIFAFFSICLSHLRPCGLRCRDNLKVPLSIYFPTLVFYW